MKYDFEELLKLNARDQIIKTHNVVLPISGGRGNSREDAIVFDKISYDKGINMEYQILGFLLNIAGIGWQTVKAEMFSENGKKYEKIKLVFDGDDEYYHNYYFDITNFEYPD